MRERESHLGKRLPLLIMILALMLVPAMAVAQDAGNVADVVDDGNVDGDEAVEEEESAFNNPAQAQKAENLAEAAAQKSEDQELADRVEALEAAEQELAGLTPDDPGYQAALDAVEAAEQDVADRLGEISGETVADIDKMREEGYGWGQIAHELGVHPSVLGLGHKHGLRKTERHMERGKSAKGKKGEFAAATERDVKTGWGKGHGVSAGGKGKGGGKGKPGFLDDSDVSGKAKGKGKSGNAGKGNDKGGGKGKN